MSDASMVPSVSRTAPRPLPVAALVTATLLLAALPFVPAVEAGDASGRLSFDDVPRISGALGATGQGEALLGDDGTLVLDAAASSLRIERTWNEVTYVANPVTGPVMADMPDDQHDNVTYDAASIRLESMGAGFVGLLFTGDGAALQVPVQQVSDLPLAAHSNPHLVLDDSVDPQVRDGEKGVFTWRSDGDRFPLQADALRASGTLGLYLWDATLVVTDADGSETRYTSGVREEADTPTSWREVREFHVLRLDEAALQLAGGTTVAWFDGPTFTLDGTLTANAATGAIRVDSEQHDLVDEAVTLVGTVTLRPIAAGEPVPATDEGTRIGTMSRSDGVYPRTDSPVGGDVQVLAIGADAPYVDQGAAAVAASIGVLTLAGAVLLLTPQGKWLLAGLFAPLYAKTERDRLLENDSRDRIYQAICANPGINLSEIHRLAELGWGVTVYHLKMMEKNGLVVSETGAREKCFFENDPRFSRMRSAIAALANKEPAQKVAAAVVQAPGLNQRDVIAATGLSQRAVSYYLRRLAQQGLVEATRVKNFVHYTPGAHLDEALRMVHGIDVPAPASLDAQVVEATVHA